MVALVNDTGKGVQLVRDITVKYPLAVRHIPCVHGNKLEVLDRPQEIFDVGASVGVPWSKRPQVNIGEKNSLLLDELNAGVAGGVTRCMDEAESIIAQADLVSV